MRTNRNLPVLALIAAIAMVSLVGCDETHDHHHETVYIRNGVLVELPPGGVQFGLVDHFDSGFHVGTITGFTDANGYTLDLFQASSLVVSVEGLAGFDPFVEIYGPGGIFLASNDDGGIGVDALLVGNQPAGRYSILVWGSEFGPPSGKYELNFLVGTPTGADLEELDHGDLVDVNGSLNAGSDAHTYVFTLMRDSKVDFDVLQLVGGGADIAIELVDQRGQQVFFFDPAGLADPIVLDEPLAAGTYMLVVSNEMMADFGDYILTVEVTP